MYIIIRGFEKAADHLPKGCSWASSQMAWIVHTSFTSAGKPEAYDRIYRRKRAEI